MKDHINDLEIYLKTNFKIRILKKLVKVINSDPNFVILRKKYGLK
jgi:hypothetical protein